MSRKPISEALKAKSMVNFKVDSFKLSPSLFTVSKKSSTFLIYHSKINLGRVGLLLNIPDQSTENLGCSPTVNLPMGSWYAEIADLSPVIVLYS